MFVQLKAYLHRNEQVHPNRVHQPEMNGVNRKSLNTRTASISITNDSRIRADKHKLKNFRTSAHQKPIQAPGLCETAETD